MKIITGVVLVLFLTLPAVPALADDTFRALSKISTKDQALLTPLDDHQLASIEGASHKSGQKTKPINIGINIAVIPQLNICVLCTDVTQRNAAVVPQVTRF